VHYYFDKQKQILSAVGDERDRGGLPNGDEKDRGGRDVHP
jgi:hypothetical protein